MECLELTVRECWTCSQLLHRLQLPHLHTLRLATASFVDCKTAMKRFISCHKQLTSVDFNYNFVCITAFFEAAFELFRSANNDFVNRKELILTTALQLDDVMVTDFLREICDHYDCFCKVYLLEDLPNLNVRTENKAFENVKKQSKRYRVCEIANGSLLVNWLFL